MKCTDHPFLLVGDEQHAYPALFHHADRFGGKRLGPIVTGEGVMA